jgi:hypothetical protein
MKKPLFVSFIKIEEFRIRPEEINSYIPTMLGLPSDQKPAICLYRKSSDLVINLTFKDEKSRDEYIKYLDTFFEPISIERFNE